MTLTRTHVTPADQFVVIGEDEHTLKENFERFDRENPHVYSTLVRLVQEWRGRRPKAKLSMKMLFEVMRWQIAISTTGEPLRLNNNYTAFYARKLMDEHPELRGVFETRRQRSES